MTVQGTVFAPTEADLVFLLTEEGILAAGQAGRGFGYAYKGDWSLASGAAMKGKCALFWWATEPANAAESAAREATLASLRAKRALYEGDPVIYLMGETGPQRPDDHTLIGQLRDARKFSKGYKVGNHWFHSDQGSRGQQLGLVIAAASNMLPAGLTWKTMSGDAVPMTAQLAQQIFAAAMQSDAAYHAVGEAARAQLAAGTLTDVYSIQCPQGFGE